jgi:NitT/TauT family transport system substrate-binding protein
VALALATSACGSSGSTAQSSGGLTEITIANALSTSYAPIWVGVQQGIYKQHGVDLKIKTVATSAAALVGQQSGELQFAGTSLAAIPPPVAQGVPVKLVVLLVSNPAEKFYDSQVNLVARAGVTAATAANLRGLTIGTQFGSAPDLWLRTKLKQAALNPDQDVKLVNVTSANMPSVMVSKAVDAVVTTQPYTSFILSTLSGSKVLMHGGGIVDIRVGITALGPWVEKNSKVTEAMAAATLQSQQYVRQHPAEAATVASQYINMPVPVLESAIMGTSYDARWSTLTEQGFAESTQQLVAQGVIKSAPPISSMVLKTATSVASRYPQYFTDLSKQ